MCLRVSICDSFHLCLHSCYLHCFLYFMPLFLSHISLLSLQGTNCDVREGQDVKDLVAFAQKNLKYIDIWVLIPYTFLCHPQHLNIFPND